MQIALHRAPGLIGTLIRWQTRGEYSHASMLMDDGSVIESREGHGVRRLPRLVRRKGETIDLFNFFHSPEQNRQITTFLEAQIGKPYDYTMVARFVTRRQASRAQSGKWFCSELIYAALQQAQLPVFRATDPWEVSPGLLARSPLLQITAQPS
jgi:uncharacterized protein YycO